MGGHALDCNGGTAYTSGESVKIDRQVDKMDTAVIYFNLIREGPAGPTDSDRRATLQAKLDYYTKLSKPLSFSDRKEMQKQIDRANSEITQKLEEIKAFTGTALAEAVNVIEVRQAQIRTLRKEVRSSQESLDGTSYDDQIAELDKQIAKTDDDAKSERQNPASRSPPGRRTPQSSPLFHSKQRRPVESLYAEAFSVFSGAHHR